LVLFHEYFHGETGRGLGASHQTGWTALTAKLLEKAVENPAGVADANGDGISAIPRATGAKLAALIDRHRPHSGSGLKSSSVLAQHFTDSERSCT
jgi:hypothetical protein